MKSLFRTILIHWQEVYLKEILQREPRSTSEISLFFPRRAAGCFQVLQQRGAVGTALKMTFDLSSRARVELAVEILVHAQCIIGRHGEALPRRSAIFPSACRVLVPIAT